jgi:LysM repeat protein
MSRVHQGARYAGFALVLMLTLASIFAPVAAQAAANPAPVEAPQNSYGCSTYHYVRYGQTLSQIAASYGVSVQAVMQANGIYNPNHIYAGQKLCIPGGGGYPDYPDHPGGNCYTYHYVRHGQTLSGIAAYYGVSVHALMAANGIHNPNHIYSGQKLCIPGDGGYHPKPPPKPEPPVHPKPPSDGCTYHLVKPGQTLSGIAAYYGVSVHSLMYLNGIKNPNHIYVGQWLKVNCHTPPPDPCGYHPCPPPPPPPPKPPVDPCHQPCQPHPPVDPCHGVPPAGHPPACPPPHPPKPPVDPCHQPCQPHPPQGGSWTGSYFNNKYLEGHPVFVRQDAEVRFNWYGGSPGEGIGNDHFSVRWERKVYFETGHYRFLATSDDGVRVYVDGIKVIDGWNVHPTTDYAQDVYIHGGHHTVVVEYFEESGDANIYVRWGRR